MKYIHVHFQNTEVVVVQVSIDSKTPFIEALVAAVEHINQKYMVPHGPPCPQPTSMILKEFHVPPQQPTYAASDWDFPVSPYNASYDYPLNPNPVPQPLLHT